MAVSVVADTQAGATSNSVSCGKPTGTVSGDVMVAVHTCDWGTYSALTAPAGWSLAVGRDGGTNGVHLKVWIKTAGGSEPSSYAFAQTGVPDSCVSIITTRGTSATSPVTVAPTAQAGGSTARTAPSLTGVPDGALLLCAAMLEANNAALTWTPPSGMTEQTDIQSSTWNGHGTASLVSPPATTGVRTFTSSTSGSGERGGVGASLALRSGQVDADVTPPTVGVTAAAPAAAAPRPAAAGPVAVAPAAPQVRGINVTTRADVSFPLLLAPDVEHAAAVAAPLAAVTAPAYPPASIVLGTPVFAHPAEPALAAAPVSASGTTTADSAAALIAVPDADGATAAAGPAAVAALTTEAQTPGPLVGARPDPTVLDLAAWTPESFTADTAADVAAWTGAAHTVGWSASPTAARAALTVAALRGARVIPAGLVSAAVAVPDTIGSTATILEVARWTVAGHRPGYLYTGRAAPVRVRLFIPGGLVPAGNLSLFNLDAAHQLWGVHLVGLVIPDLDGAVLVAPVADATAVLDELAAAGVHTDEIAAAADTRGT